MVGGVWQRFFFRSQLLGQVRYRALNCKDYAWVTKEELLEYFELDLSVYMKQMLVDDLRVIYWDFQILLCLFFLSKLTNGVYSSMGERECNNWSGFRGPKNFPVWGGKAGEISFLLYFMSSCFAQVFPSILKEYYELHSKRCAPFHVPYI